MEKCFCNLCGDDNVNNFYKSSKTRCKKCKIEKSNEWINKNFVKSQLLQAKHRAKRDGLIFEIDINFINRKLIEQDYRCKLSGIEMVMTNNKWNSLSFDRLDSNIGYTVDNTILVTKFVNISKNTYSVHEFKQILEETYLGISKNLP